VTSIRSIDDKRKITSDDILSQGIKKDVNNLVKAFDDNWKLEPIDNPSIWRVLYRTLKRETNFLFITIFVTSSLRFFVAYIVEQLLFNIRKDTSKTLYFFIFIFIQIINAFWLHHLALHLHNFGVLIKSTLIGTIYKKIHSLTLNSIDKFSKGKIINIASAELSQISGGLGLLPCVFLLPYFIIICTGMLWKLFGWYAIFGLASQIIIAQI